MQAYSPPNFKCCPAALLAKAEVAPAFAGGVDWPPHQGGPMIRKPAALFLAALFASAAHAHDEDAKSAAQQLGKVDFPSSCSPKVKDKVTRGVAMLHSFWWSQGEATFQEIG